MVISYDILEPNVRYSFTLSYINALNLNISGSLNIGSITTVVPNIDPPTNLSPMVRYTDQTIGFNYLDNACPEYYYNYSVIYTQSFGPLLSLADMVQETQIVIPECTLKKQTTYIFQLAVTYDIAPNFALIYPFQFIVPADVIQALIRFVNRD
jgi:hypothetical protein